jgi:PiT family inorganic phosphate transporter
LAASGWGIFSWWRAIPISSSHALIAGLAGASWSAWGTHHLMNPTFVWVFLVLFFSPLAACLLSMGLTALLKKGGEWMTPKVFPWVERLQAVGCMLVAAVDGSNDGQMAMGVLVLTVGLGHPSVLMASQSGLVVPFSLRLAVAIVIALGVLLCGHKILKKLGMSIYRIQAIEGLGSQLAASGLVLGCLSFGFPASTTHVITGSIVGAGIMKNIRSVRWDVAKEIAFSWFLTIPSVTLLAALIYKVIAGVK